MPERRDADAGGSRGSCAGHSAVVRPRRVPRVAGQSSAGGDPRGDLRTALGGARGCRIRHPRRGRRPDRRKPEPGVSRYRVSMDIGGTFTDVVAYDEQDGTYAAGKASTTPADLTEGVLAGLEQVVGSPEDISFTVHGTTQGLNAFLQRRGERVLLLATRGAGDVYHIARGNRTRLYDIHFRKPEPLLPRADIVEVGGRLDYAGEEIEPLDEDAIRAAAARARDEGFGAVAVAFLFSYVNPAHE